MEMGSSKHTQLLGRRLLSVKSRRQEMEKKFWPIVVAGGILLIFIGAFWAISPLPSQADQPTPPLADLLLREGDFPDCRLGCEQVEEQDAEEMARELAEFVGLSPDYSEGRVVYFIVYSFPDPKAVAHGLYRYESEKEAIAHYEHLTKALPQAPLGRGTPIISRSEWSFEGVKGEIIEAQDPAGTAYWFVGVRGKLLTIMVVLGTESVDGMGSTGGQPVFQELLPIVVERMAGLQ
jgi:hypothetical protein